MQVLCPSFLQVFLRSSIWAVVSLAIAVRYFAGYWEMAASALVSIGFSETFRRFLDENREQIWGQKCSPREANTLLSLRIILAFGAIFLSSFVIQLLAKSYWPDPRTPLADVNFTRPWLTILENNLQVLAASFIFALVYRSGGLMLILAWNGLSWGRDFAHLILQRLVGFEPSVTPLSLLSILPHLFLEVAAYVLGGMAGVFLSQAVTKYQLNDERIQQVSFACLRLLVLAVGLVAAGAVLESSIAGHFIR